MTPMTGRVIAGRYILDEPIGRGGMGVVWRAHDRLLDRSVAVKEVDLSAAMVEDEAAILDRTERLERTQREARILARLSHPNIVKIYDVAEDYGRPWIVMELIPAPSLQMILASRGPLTVLSAARIGQQLLSALTVAHAAGVLHRDVKPSNVLIAYDGSGDGRFGGDSYERAVLTDFGIAQVEGATRLTQAANLMQTLGFTAPERYGGCDATTASDLWSLGATIYAAAEGRGPFERSNDTSTLFAVVHEPPPPALSAGPLAPLIAALLHREPSARPSAATAEREFARVLSLITGEAAPISFADLQRDDTELPVLPAPPSLAPHPLAPSAPPTQTSPKLGSDLLGQFAWEAGGDPRRPPRRARGRGSVRRTRKPVFITAGSAAAVAAVFVFAHYGFSSHTSRPAAESLSPTASAAPVPLPSPPSTPAIVKAIDNPTMQAPQHYTGQNFYASMMGTKAGFTIYWPQDWQLEKRGQQVYLCAPGVTCTSYVEIDLAKHAKSDIMSEAEYLAAQNHSGYPGYRLIVGTGKKFIQAENIHSTPGALWQFDWTTVQGVSIRMNVLLFDLGGQSYTIYMTGPAGAQDTEWNKITLPIVQNMLASFDNLPPVTSATD